MPPTADRKTIFPPSAKPAGPYTPGLLIDNLLYISGQGARDEKNEMPSTFEGQLAQCLRNIESIIEAGELKMSDIVQATVYLPDLEHLDVIRETLPKATVVVVARMPGDTPIEITVVAAKGVPDRSFISAVEAATIEELKNNVTGPDYSNLASLTVFHTSAVTGDQIRQGLAEKGAAINAVEVKALPGSATMAVLGVAASETQSVERHSPECVALGETVYCALQVPKDESADIADLTRQVLVHAEAQLRSADAMLSDVVVCNVYLDEISDFAAMNAAYGSVFPTPPPTRTTIQPAPSARAPKVRISMVARRSK